MINNIQLLSTIVVLLATIYGVYNSLSQKSVSYLNKISTQELKIHYLEVALKEHARRLDDHDKQNQSILLLAEQIKNLSEDVTELTKKVSQL